MTRLPRLGHGAWPPRRVSGALLAARTLVAWPLLNTTTAILVAGCLPPDFEVAPRENQPVTIDKALLSYSPDQFQEVACEERVFDVQGAISDEDGDRLQIAWILDYAPNRNLVPDVVGQFRFTYTPCFTPRWANDKVQTLEMLVFDRPLPLGLTVDELKAFAEDDVTSDSVVWFIKSQCGVCP